MSNRRLHYFNHQFLDEQDFRDEQHYMVSMRRHHNRLLHSWGVVEGLEVRKSGNREIIIEPGFALDQEGRELIVSEPLGYEIKRTERYPELQVVLMYKEELERHEQHDEESDRPAGASEGFNRVAEYAEVRLIPGLEKITTGVPLAMVHLNGEGDITHIDHENRHMAGIVIPHGAVHTRHLADGAVTAPKLAADVFEVLRPGGFTIPDDSITFEKLSPDVRSRIGARGWVRLPFRPDRLLRPKREREKERWLEGEFGLDIEFAHSDGRGARGTMAIPVPAGASYIREFRIAGITQREINVHLIRTGWNPQDRKGESTTIFKETLRNAVFDQKFRAEQKLDDFHSVTVSVHATGESEIWLVAARFE